MLTVGDLDEQAAMLGQQRECGLRAAQSAARPSAKLSLR
jgi:hypothetical protein